ncbi:MAG: hypothetical protein ABS67_00065 [Niabella sp. SCN 42-15]|nr:MAG: hypothetical protein ABS67_00065 [Niabella sp. SCN 42-15]
MLNNIFGQSIKFDIVFKETTALNDFQNGETQSEILSNGALRITVSLNSNILPNAAVEYSSRTMFHEFLHAYLQYTGSYGILKNHNEIANQYVDSLASALKANFPNMTAVDAKALSWGGLQDTNAWDSIQDNHFEDSQEILSINAKYRIANGKGTKCQGQ